MSSHNSSRRSSLNPNAPEFVIPSSNESSTPSSAPSMLEQLLMPQSPSQSSSQGINPYATTYQPYSGIAYNYYTKPYLSVNQSNMSMSQPINQPFDPAMTNLPPVHPVANNHSFNPSRTTPAKTRRLDSRSVPASPGQSSTRSISRILNRPNNQPTDQAVTSSNNSYPDFYTNNQSPNQSPNQPSKQSNNQPVNPRYYQRRASYDQSAISRYVASINQSNSQPSRIRYTKQMIISVNHAVNQSADIYEQCEWYQKLKNSVKDSILQLPGVMKSDIELIEEDNGRSLFSRSTNQVSDGAIISAELPPLIHPLTQSPEQSLSQSNRSTPRQSPILTIRSISSLSPATQSPALNRRSLSSNEHSNKKSNSESPGQLPPSNNSRAQSPAQSSSRSISHSPASLTRSINQSNDQHIDHSNMQPINPPVRRPWLRTPQTPEAELRKNLISILNKLSPISRSSFQSVDQSLGSISQFDRLVLAAAALEIQTLNQLIDCLIIIVKKAINTDNLSINTTSDESNDQSTDQSNNQKFTTMYVDFLSGLINHLPSFNQSVDQSITLSIDPSVFSDQSKQLASQSTNLSNEQQTTPQSQDQIWKHAINQSVNQTINHSKQETSDHTENQSADQPIKQLDDLVTPRTILTALVKYILNETIDQSNNRSTDQTKLTDRDRSIYQLVGESFRHELIDRSIVMSALDALLHQSAKDSEPNSQPIKQPDVSELEALAQLLHTAGARLDRSIDSSIESEHHSAEHSSDQSDKHSVDQIANDKDKERLDAAYGRIKQLIDQSHDHSDQPNDGSNNQSTDQSTHHAVPSRLRFRLTDLIELRSNHWAPKRKKSITHSKLKLIESLNQSLNQSPTQSSTQSPSKRSKKETVRFSLFHEDDDQSVTQSNTQFSSSQPITLSGNESGSQSTNQSPATSKRKGILKHSRSAQQSPTAKWRRKEPAANPPSSHVVEDHVVEEPITQINHFSGLSISQSMQSPRSPAFRPFAQSTDLSINSSNNQLMTQSVLKPRMTRENLKMFCYEIVDEYFQSVNETSNQSINQSAIDEACLCLVELTDKAINEGLIDQSAIQTIPQSINQSHNQSNNQSPIFSMLRSPTLSPASINQSTNQSISQSVYNPLNPRHVIVVMSILYAINQSIKQTIGQQIKQTNNQSVKTATSFVRGLVARRSINLVDLIDGLIGVIDRLVDWLIDYLNSIDRLIDCLIDCLAFLTLDHCINLKHVVALVQRIDQAINQSISRSVSPQVSPQNSSSDDKDASTIQSNNQSNKSTIKELIEIPKPTINQTINHTHKQSTDPFELTLRVLQSMRQTTLTQSIAHPHKKSKSKHSNNQTVYDYHQDDAFVLAFKLARGMTAIDDLLMIQSPLSSENIQSNTSSNNQTDKQSTNQSNNQSNPEINQRLHDHGLDCLIPYFQSATPLQWNLE